MCLRVHLFQQPPTLIICLDMTMSLGADVFLHTALYGDVPSCYRPYLAIQEVKTQSSMG